MSGEEKNKGGRPPKWENVEAFERDSAGFFDWCEKKNYIPDIEALAEYLNTNRMTLLEYENNPKFSYTIKAIKNKIANQKKQRAMQGLMPSAVFCFDFKNNHSYTDRQEIKHEVGDIQSKQDYDNALNEVMNLAKELGVNIESKPGSTTST